MRYALNAKDVLQRGYNKVSISAAILHTYVLIILYQYRGSVFRVPEFFRWQVIVTGEILVQELQMASGKDLSFTEAMADVGSE